MPTPRKTQLFGAIFGLGIVALGVYYPLVNHIQDISSVLETISHHLVTEKLSEQRLQEAAWAQVGGIAYQAASQLIAINNIRPQGLDPIQKRYLRPHFGDLVDRVVVAYNATLMEDWVAASFQLKNVGVSNAQVYGHKIYIKDRYKPGDFDQMVLLAHELVHCRQYEELGTMKNFGHHYFKQYKKAGKSYRDNIFEKEAFEFEAKFAKWLKEEMAKDKSYQ